MDELMNNYIYYKDYDSYNYFIFLCTNFYFQGCNYQYHIFINKDMSLKCYL